MSARLSWSHLDREVQILRQGAADDGFTSAGGTFAVHGDPLRAGRLDVSDGERWRAGEVASSIMARFRLRWSPFTAALTPKDRLVCDGLEFDIVGLKEIKRRQWIEITGSARLDT